MSSIQFGFSEAIVRRPCASFASGLTTSGLGPPDIGLALRQHAEYVGVLEDCGLRVCVLEGEDAFPDSTFVEDAAVLMPGVAVLTRPGAESRRGEVGLLAPAVRSHFPVVHEIRSPGTLDGGDVLHAGDRFFVGVSARTNPEGVGQFRRAVAPAGFEVVPVELNRFLHLKTGVAYLGDGCLAVAGELAEAREFAGYRRLRVGDEELYAANCIMVRQTLVMAAGFPKTERMFRDAGFQVRLARVSEFQKMDGGLSCLSLRF